ncbi:hypothetical protein NM208_g838 [Fusarium decemcellulare]|uniref:Uncharacterized protein n=1 Tax=Fusarium decemcellulare TaxID=57161 RepID=A0ACC1SYH2_9HYPO|nr:hypothetical protein NM208_g838 [Fusarium decemcellulare]
MVATWSETTIVQLIQASPVMLAQYVSSKRQVMRENLATFLATDRDGGLLEDALAIIRRSPVNSTSYLIPRHLRPEKEENLPGTIEQLDDKTIFKLCRLFSRLVLFIEDYLTKATNIFPPGAFLTLPDIASGSPGLYFKNRPAKINMVSLESLTCAERHRFFRAFIRYELFCKTYHPCELRTVGPSPYHELVRHSQLAHMNEASRDKRQLFDYETLFCVNRYIRTVYGAIFVHCADSWPPETQFLSTDDLVTSAFGGKPEEDKDLLFPDTVYFNASNYFMDMGYPYESDDLADILPSYGLDLLTHILMSLGKKQEDWKALKGWFCALPEKVKAGWDPWVGVANMSSTPQFTNSAGPGLRHQLYPKVWRCLACPPGSERFSDQYWSRQVLQLEVYRQRAWAFFDDSRLYPNGISHFPTMDELTAQRPRICVSCHDPSFEHRQRRFQQWTDGHPGRDLGGPYATLKRTGDEELGAVEDNYGCIPGFFEKPRNKKLITFWRSEPTK